MENQLFIDRGNHLSFGSENLPAEEKKPIDFLSIYWYLIGKVISFQGC